MPRRTAAPALALLILILVACGGGTTPTGASATQPATGGDAQPSSQLGGVLDDKAPGTTLDACGIVTATDIGTATKTATVPAGTFKAAPTVLSPGRSLCTYEGDFGRILVELTPEDGENLYDAASKAYKDGSAIAGIGDGAFFAPKNHRAFVWKGNVTVMLTIFLNDGGDQLPVATELAKQAVGKL